MAMGEIQITEIRRQKRKFRTEYVEKSYRKEEKGNRENLKKKRNGALYRKRKKKE